ncbi:MAG: hypothetical protein Greene041662_545 [Candidatus Peregrinibacteria bacterium Greene0416_62]|nr:MAG: hypothetical protein Greene041662_545 [Candidatus Peregrinibacteria bacterium Greene0416_62]TSC99411.1 MAG: hypothetical protein Greene101449_622 [Candidatus Peregrinibacteria bacterium Greene1014_49]
MGSVPSKPLGIKSTAKAPVLSEKEKDVLKCVLDISDPEFEAKKEAFFKNDPPDVSAMPEGPITLGEGIHVTIEKTDEKNSNVRIFRKVQLTYPHPEKASDPIVCNGKAFTMHTDAIGWVVQIRTLATTKQSGTKDAKEGLGSDVKAGWYSGGSFTTTSQLRAMCAAMDGYVPPKEDLKTPEVVGKFDNEGNSVWFHPAALSDPAQLAANEQAEEVPEPMGEPMEVEVK